ncbi:MAG: hypothetical protein GDA44_11110 [Prochloron sp. SP5CPC1]|nr:hypothetical protein [Candidatus Paraprochloron terpiosi SP5CPC1]
MFAQVHYLIRSKLDGKYLVARPKTTEVEYLLTFQEQYQALTYLNTHGGGVTDRFGVESVSGTQLKGVLQRWQYGGIGLVEDPLLPQIQFLSII